MRGTFRGDFMKKLPLYILILILGIAVGGSGLFLILRSTNRQVVDNALGNASPVTAVSAASSTSRELVDLAMEAAEYIKAEDYVSLANMVHPTYGVYFSPSATVNLKTNQCFTSAEVSAFGDDTNSYVWGAAAGSTVPIELGISDYIKQYVYNSDYLNAQIIGINCAARTGNSLENVTEIFPNAQYVDLCFPGTAENEYHDWSILRLVFEEYDGIFRLTALIHSEYTI